MRSWSCSRAVKNHVISNKEANLYKNMLNDSAKMFDPAGLSSSGSPPYCLRVLGRKPTISIASCSRSKSCLRSSPSTVKQSCWCQVDTEKREGRRQRRRQHRRAGKRDLESRTSRRVLQPAGRTVLFRRRIAQRNRHSSKVLKTSSE